MKTKSQKPPQSGIELWVREGVNGKNIAKGATDPGVDCFDQ